MSSDRCKSIESKSRVQFPGNYLDKGGIGISIDRCNSIESMCRAQFTGNYLDKGVVGVVLGVSSDRYNSTPVYMPPY